MQANNDRLLESVRRDFCPARGGTFVWQKFTDKSRRAVSFSQEEAGRRGQNHVSTEHLLLGLLSEKDNRALLVLKRIGISPSRIRREIEQQTAHGGEEQSGQDMPLAPRTKRVIFLAWEETRQLGNDCIDTEHLLLGLIREGGGITGHLFSEMSVELDRVRQEVKQLDDAITAPATIPQTTKRIIQNTAVCPSCSRPVVSAGPTSSKTTLPEFCPHCFERLRLCPICGAANTWLVRVCHVNPEHLVRASPNWGGLGGGPAHTGNVEVNKVSLALSRRWSFPTTATKNREKILTWSAPVAAYGLVAAAAVDPSGNAYIFAFDVKTGRSLWERFSLPDPVYPDRGGIAVSDGQLFAATIEGMCISLDPLSGTRIWQTEINGQVFGAVTPTEDNSTILVPVASGTSGFLVMLDAKSGKSLHRVALPGPPICAAAGSGTMAFVHDDSGSLTAINLQDGTIQWAATCSAKFNAAPVVYEGNVFSAAADGKLWCHEAETGRLLFNLSVTTVPFSGTPACHGPLIYLPSDNGVYVANTLRGRIVRHYLAGQPVRSAPIIVGGTLFFGASDGSIYGAVAGQPAEKLYETETTGSQIVAAPAYADDTLFITATNGVLYALNPVDL